MSHKKVSLISFKKNFACSIYSVIQLWLILHLTIMISPFIQDSVQQDYIPELYTRYLLSYQKCQKIVAPTRCGLSHNFPQTFMGNHENEGKSYPTAKNLLISSTRKIPLNRFKSFAIKSFISSPSNSNFQVITLATFICSCSHFCRTMFWISGFIYTHVMLIWLINVYWMLPLALQKHWIIEALPSKISIPSTFPFPASLDAISKTQLLLMPVFLFFTLPFL